MTPFSTWKTLGYAAAIFAAGGISGGAVGTYYAHRAAGQPHDQEMARRMRERLQQRLQLTPDQMQKIDPIIDKTTADLRALRQATMQQVEKVFEDAYQQVSALVTPEQKVKLDRLMREHREAVQQRWGRLREGRDGHWHPGFFQPPPAGQRSPDGPTPGPTPGP